MSTYASQCVADFKGRTADYFMLSHDAQREMAESIRVIVEGYLASYQPLVGPTVAGAYLRGIASNAIQLADQCDDRIKEMND